MFKRLFLLLPIISLSPVFAQATSPETAPPSAETIVSHCDYKDPGLDQRTKMTLTVAAAEGRNKKSQYLRLWKRDDKRKEFGDKLLLITQYPPDAKGMAFLRFSETSKGKSAIEQWIYLPVSRSISPVVLRDPSESFLGSDLTHGDIDPRNIDQDTHKLLSTKQTKEGTIYLVEHKPHEKKPQYSKRISRYLKPNDWQSCHKNAVLYFDKHGYELKRQNIAWQQVDGAWLWEKVLVQNLQTKHRSIFEISDVEINVGLKDRTFTQRTMQRGYRP